MGELQAPHRRVRVGSPDPVLVLHAERLVVTRLEQFVQVVEPVHFPVSGQPVAPPLVLCGAAELPAVNPKGVAPVQENFRVLGMGVVDAIGEVADGLDPLDALPHEVRRVVAQAEGRRRHGVEHRVPHLRGGGQHRAVAGPVFEGQAHVAGFGMGRDGGVQLLEDGDVVVAAQRHVLAQQVGDDADAVSGGPVDGLRDLPGQLGLLVAVRAQVRRDQGAGGVEGHVEVAGQFHGRVVQDRHVQRDVADVGGTRRKVCVVHAVQRTVALKAAQVHVCRFLGGGGGLPGGCPPLRCITRESG